MNAVIGVGQFCEIHGPCLIFCTQTVYEAIQENTTFEVEDGPEVNNISSVPLCEACNSVGIGRGFICRDDDDNNVSYISTQFPRKIPLRQHLKQACVRSLSCEVGGSTKSDEGGTMCFSDSDQGGHTVLCHTWRVPDSQSRGFHRWLTIVLLMKDRFMLMTAWSFYIQHIQEIVKYLQDAAQKVYSVEENNGNNRAARIQSGRAPTCPPRSLAHLCGLPTIWGYLHTRLAWILHSAPRALQEIPPTRSGIDGDLAAKASSHSKGDAENKVSFRDLSSQISLEGVTALCHCLTTGIQVILRGDEHEGARYAQLLTQILPPGQSFLCGSPTYLSPSECPLLTVDFSVALPKPSSYVFRIDMMPGGWVIKWNGDLPDKSSSFVTSLCRSIADSRLNIPTMEAQIRCLRMQWLNIVRAVHMAGPNGFDKQLMLVLGVSSEDKCFVTHWLNWLTRNESTGKK